MRYEIGTKVRSRYTKAINGVVVGYGNINGALWRHKTDDKIVYLVKLDDIIVVSGPHKHVVVNVMVMNAEDTEEEVRPLTREAAVKHFIEEVKDKISVAGSTPHQHVLVECENHLVQLFVKTLDELLGPPPEVLIECPACEPGRPAVALPGVEIRQGQYGNCAVCFRQMRVVPPAKQL